MNFVFVILIT